MSSQKTRKRGYADSSLFVNPSRKKPKIDQFNKKENLEEIPIENKWINPSNEKDKVLLSDKIAISIKPHQLEGIKFLWRTVVEESSGCILAHTMGLGKSLQTIVFLNLLFERNYVKHVIISAPNSVISSWENEINKWSKSLNLEHVINIEKFNFSEVNQEKKRVELLNKYKENGGILLISQTIIFQLMAKSNSDTLLFTKERYLRNKELFDFLFEEPGPDIIIVDEASMMKTKKNLFYQTVSQMKTKKRILLTGTPLQNNLKELFSMVTFVRPGFWNYENFKSVFVDPISLGSLSDSTESDVELMKKRSFLLVMQLKSIAHRVNQQVLIDSLPEKKEFVLMIEQTPLQLKLCNAFVEFLELDEGLDKLAKFGGLLKCVAILHKIVNSPDLLRRFMIDHKIIKLEDSSKIKLSNRNSKKIDINTRNNNQDNLFKEDIFSKNNKQSNLNFDEDNENDDELIQKLKLSDVILSQHILNLKSEQIINYSWAKDVIDESFNCIEMEENTKIKIVYSILEKAFKENRKALIFSQFTSTLDIIEMFFKKYPINGEFLRRGLTYSRMDGKTPTMVRKELIDNFNDEDWPCKVFLLSTKAGGIGLNLQAASCLVLIDVMWNPTNDNQALCRCFRFGQKRDVHVYRLVTKATVEDTIYKKSLNKVWLSRRVVDDEINKRFLDFDHVFSFRFRDTKEIQADNTIDESYLGDSILSKVYQENSSLIKAIYKHEGLYIQDPDEMPTTEEMRISIEDFKNNRIETASSPSLIQQDEDLIYNENQNEDWHPIFEHFVSNSDELINRNMYTKMRERKKLDKKSNIKDFKSTTNLNMYSDSSYIYQGRLSFSPEIQPSFSPNQIMNSYSSQLINNSTPLRQRIEFSNSPTSNVQLPPLLNDMSYSNFQNETNNIQDHDSDDEIRTIHIQKPTQEYSILDNSIQNSTQIISQSKNGTSTSPIVIDLD